MDDVKYSERTQRSSENTPAERTTTLSRPKHVTHLYLPGLIVLHTRPWRNRRRKVQQYDIIDGDGLAGERVDPEDVYVNKQTPTNANDNTTVSAVAAGFKNTPLTNKAPVPGYIDMVEHPLYCEDVCS